MSLTEVFTDDPTVSRAAALAEVARHNIPAEEFLAECGDFLAYSGRAVLEWLGY